MKTTKPGRAIGSLVNDLIRPTPIVLVSLIASISTGTAFADASYSVRINLDRPRQADVVATVVPGARGLCFTRSADTSGLPHGWATFVHGMSVSDIEGHPLTAEYDGNGCWQVPVSDAVTAEYTMLLQHDSFPNRPGDDEIAYAGDWGQFWTGRTLFVEGKPDPQVGVDFELPPGWVVTAPWPVADDTGMSFTLSDYDFLFDSGIMLGTHESHQFDHGDATLHVGLAGAGPLQRSEELTTLIQGGLTSFTELHNAPPVGHFAVFLGQSRRAGGGVMGQTISMVVPGEISDELMPQLTHLVTHEAFHLWNTNLNYTVTSDMYWFSEGFAEYFTYRAMQQRGLMDISAMFEAFERQETLYLKAVGQISMVDAGAEKLNNYDLVYSGGMMAALALDMHILDSSRGRSRLDDVLPLIYSRHGAGSDTGLNLATLTAAIESQTDVNAQDLLMRYVAGLEILPVAELRARLAETL